MKRLLYFVLLSLSVASNAQHFQWKSLPLGGGGFLTGIVIHDKQKDLIYARTDVGGIYKYNPPKNKNSRPSWTQLMNWIPLEEMHLWSCDGIGLNPLNVNEIYAFLGSASYNPKPFGLYKSNDQGKSWKQVYETQCRGNENERWIGEPIAVQPLNKGKIVLAGTRFNGVIRSLDGGEKWTKVESIPSDPKGMGIRCIVFDPKTPQRVYAIDATSVYKSEDSGNSFVKILDGVGMRQGAVSSEGCLYVTTNNGVYAGYSSQNLEKLNGYDFGVDLNAITIDKHNPKHIIVAEQGTFNCKIFRTVDGGATWKRLSDNVGIKNHVPWYNRQHFAAALVSLKLDPHYKNRLWFTDWYLPWMCKDVSGEEALFESVPWGVEELVVFDMVSPPNDMLLYQGCADNGGFSHSSLAEYPTIEYDNQESTGIDFCETYPNNIVRVSSLGWGDSNFKISLSDDCGKTWKQVGGEIYSTGKVAYSAQDIKNFIFAPTGWNQTMKYTINGGTTPMEESKGLPSFSVNTNFWDNWNRFIASDRVNGSKYYVALPGSFYVSTDGGINFRKTAEIPGQEGTPAYYIAVSPYKEGSIWLSTGKSGLYYSSDSGQTFEKKGLFTSTKCVAVGPPLKNKIPVVYVYGRWKEKWGMFASFDQGVNWIRINKEDMQLSNNPRQLAADPNRPGRVYIGTGGCGIIYGECDLPIKKDYSL